MSIVIPLAEPFGAYDGRRDLERVIGEVAERLPETMQSLASLAFNYRWSWMVGGGDLFRDIDPDAWRRSGGNPRYVLEGTAPRRFQEMARDEAYVDRLRVISDAVAADLSRPNMPVAGDTLKAASDLAVPMVGVGLLYRQGYFHQRLDLDGWQREYWVDADFERLPAVRVSGPDQRPLTVELTIRQRTVRCDVWRVDFGRVP